MLLRGLFALLLGGTNAWFVVAEGERLPLPGKVYIDQERGEVVLSAQVQFPEGKPCINEYGQRVQAFIGTSKANGGDSKMAGYFVFLVDAPLEDIFQALKQLGCQPRVHYSIQEGKKRTGLRPDTKPENYLQGDPVLISVFWKEDGKTRERPYQDFVTERVIVDGHPTEKPWTPHFVFHGSGAIYKSGTGCIACPCDCAGGIIADNRMPIYDPKPIVKFHMAKAPKVGSQVYVRLRLALTRD